MCFIFCLLVTKNIGEVDFKKLNITTKHFKYWLAYRYKYLRTLIPISVSVHLYPEHLNPQKSSV